MFSETITSNLRIKERTVWRGELVEVSANRQGNSIVNTVLQPQVKGFIVGLQENVSQGFWMDASAKSLAQSFATQKSTRQTMLSILRSEEQNGKMSKRSIGDAMTISNGLLVASITGPSEPGLAIPDRRVGHVLPVQRPVPVRKATGEPALGTENCLVGDQEVPVPGEKSCCRVGFLLALVKGTFERRESARLTVIASTVHPWEVVVKGVIQSQSRRPYLETLNSVDVFPLLPPAQTSPFPTKSRIFACTLMIYIVELKSRTVPA